MGPHAYGLDQAVTVFPCIRIFEIKYPLIGQLAHALKGVGRFHAVSQRKNTHSLHKRCQALTLKVQRALVAFVDIAKRAKHGEWWLPVQGILSQHFLKQTVSANADKHFIEQVMKRLNRTKYCSHIQKNG